jgi:hypothetical protein
MLECGAHPAAAVKLVEAFDGLNGIQFAVHNEASRGQWQKIQRAIKAIERAVG